MNLIDDINSGMSKYSIFLVVATFTYLSWAVPSNPGIIGGVLFIIIGSFLIPLIVGLPLNVVKNIAMSGTGSGLLVSVIDKIGLFLVFLLTQKIYIYIFS